MPRETGTYRITTTHGESVRAFVPHPLPPASPPLNLTDELTHRHSEAVAAVGKLQIAGTMVPDRDWFLYGFVRKEALVSSEIEGTQATLRDVATFEALQASDRPDDVEEVCNYVKALSYARNQINTPGGLPLSTRLLCETHRVLMQGARGGHQQPGAIRRSQNWIGGSRPGTARFVPPPPEAIADALSHLETWLHPSAQASPHSALPPLIRIGLAHVQFETIHPFLDGNGRIGRLLITLLIEHYNLLDQPLLYLSLALKRRQQDYYHHLAAVRTHGDWEGWICFFLECVTESADDGIRCAKRIHQTLGRDRRQLVDHPRVSIPAIRLFDRLPRQPIVTVSRVVTQLHVTPPTARKAVNLLETLGILQETTGKARDRAYGYHAYLQILTGD